ncbi:MAG: Crp/Fnr family transcriptional regulator [Coprococcus sp.]|nr:Crp/Fnr family transcriptional regulator [Coprococcus sp.]
MDNNTLVKALGIILEEKYDKENPFAALENLVPSGWLINAEKGRTIIYQKDPAKYFYLLLGGRVTIMNRISWSVDSIIDYVEPPHILGLIEFIMNIPSYTAFVVAETHCFLFRIPAADFICILRQNNELCYHTLVVMGKISDHSMNLAEKKQLFRPKDMLGHYLYLQAQHKTPYVCPLTRKALSELLDINLRSLYRHIDYMEQNGFLSLQRGKIVIDREHFDRLAARYDDIIF